jgi:uroporphyrin-3 C-methyltransferase
MSDQTQNEQTADKKALTSEVSVESTIEDDSQNEVQAEPSVKSKTLVYLTVLIVILLILAALSYGGWWAWQQNKAQVGMLQQQNQTLTAQLEQTQQQVAKISSSREGFNTDLENQIAKIESLVVASAQRLNRQADTTENRWPLEEALTLARLAERRLFLDKNALVSVSLLKSADDVLADLDAASVLPLREQLASDILALNNAASVDLNGVYFQLGAIANSIRQLKWLPKPNDSVGIAQDVSPAIGFWQSIKQVVVVTRLDSVVQAPPLQSDFELWRQHTLMVLAQSQLALLAQNQALFEAAIKQAMDQLSYMDSQFSFNTLKNQLKQIQTLQLNPSWPDIGSSVEVIEAYIRQQNEPETTATTTEDNS